MRLSGFLLSFLGLLAMTGHAGAGERGLLWRVVQACVLNHKITGASFPCLSVETGKGVEAGYAVLRVPNEDTHMIVTPTARTTGIEAIRLRGSKAPDYFHDAWSARHFATDDLTTQPNRNDVAFAINSRLGRSQDQLHIHVACIRPDVKQRLAQQSAALRVHDWSRIKVLPWAPSYRAHFEASNDLAGVNVFDKVADGLGIGNDEMDAVTIVVVGAEPTGFLILARKRIPHSFDEPHGESLLDPDCSVFKKL